MAEIAYCKSLKSMFIIINTLKTYFFLRERIYFTKDFFCTQFYTFKTYKWRGMKQRILYDRMAVGVRMKKRRRKLDWSRKYVADHVGLAEKYYADIERGTCGMSIETLISVCQFLGFTMDELIYGEKGMNPDEERIRILMKRLESLPVKAQECCVQMMLLFLDGINSGEQKSPEDAADRQELIP